MPVPMLAVRVLVLVLALVGQLAHSLAADSDVSSAWDCRRPWPSLELFLPVNTKDTGDERRESEVFSVFIRSLLLFWPMKISNTSLLFLVDEEQQHSKRTHAVVSTVKTHIAAHIPGGVRFAHNAPIAGNQEHGHDRQQRIMFYADRWVRAEYVGFVDTDCLFMTYVDREDIFEGSKPVVNGRNGNPLKYQNGGEPGDLWWAMVPSTTFDVLGMLEPMRCMSYFPVVVKTAHIREMREYIEARHGRSFDEVFRDHLIGRPYSQFNIMCTYLFVKHRDKYAWYVHDVSPEWDYHNPPPAPGQENDSSLFTPSMRLPKPRVALHSNYRNWKEPHFAGPDGVRNIDLLLQRGVCMGPPFPKNITVCGFYNSPAQRRATVHEEMFRFEMFDWGKLHSQQALLQAMTERLERFEHCNVDFAEHNYWLMHGGSGLKQLMAFENPEDGKLYYTDETRKAIFLCKDGRLFQFPNYDTFLKMGMGDKPVGRLDSWVFQSFFSGETLPPV